MKDEDHFVIHSLNADINTSLISPAQQDSYEAPANNQQNSQPPIKPKKKANYKSQSSTSPRGARPNKNPKLRDLCQKAFALIEADNFEAFSKLVDQNADVSLPDIVDARGYTLLHEACYHDRERFTSKLMQTGKSSLKQTELQKFVNAKTKDDGFCALHFASFKGALGQIKMLMEAGADKFCVNNYGINVLHTAAQGD